MSGGQLSESVNNVVDKVVDNTKAVINNAMNVDPFVTNDPITTVVSFLKYIFLKAYPLSKYFLRKINSFYTH